MQSKPIKINNYEDLSLILSVGEVSQLLGVSNSKLYEMISEGTFPCLRVGRRVVIPRAELVHWIENNTVRVRENG